MSLFNEVPSDKLPKLDRGHIWGMIAVEVLKIVLQFVAMVLIGLFFYVAVLYCGWPPTN